MPISDHIVEHFMSSLVLELQSEVLDPSISVLNLLRKTFLVASKLNVPELKQWVNLELKGYTKYEQLPKYRFINGELKAHNPYYRKLIPVYMSDPRLSDEVCKKPVCETISQLEDLVNKSPVGDSLLAVKIPKKMEIHLMNSMDIPFPLLFNNINISSSSNT